MAGGYLWRTLWGLLFLGSASLADAQLTVRAEGDGRLSLEWQGESFPVYSGVAAKWHYQPEWSADGRTWQPLGERVTDTEQLETPPLFHRFDPPVPTALVRVTRRLEYGMAEGAAEQVSYDVQYGHFYDQAGDLASFQAAHSSQGCLSAIGWDVTAAAFWEEFNTDPVQHNAGRPPDDPDRRLFDFRLQEAERTLFEQNGFVVSEGQAAETPVDLYYNIWTDDLPVYLSCDSVFNAWHRSFSLFLEELEELYAHSQVYSLLSDQADPPLSDLRVLWQQLGDPRLPGGEQLRTALIDLQVYLGVAFALASDSIPGTAFVEDPEWWPAPATPPATNSFVQAQIGSWVREAEAADDPGVTGLFGDAKRLDDMTQFGPRGHYTNSVVLRGYFRTMIWLGRMQFRVAGPVSGAGQSLRELRAAAMLCLLMRERGLLEHWQNFENTLVHLGGERDSMSVPQMLALLEAEGINDYRALGPDETMRSLQARIMAGNYGLQRIPSGDPVFSCDPGPDFLPRTFTVFGQRWSPDAWALSKFVFPRVTDESGNVLHRRMPSSVDVGYAVLGNDAAAPILLERMADQEGVPFRDGIPFHRNLSAVRRTLDAQSEDFWSSNIYAGWLSAIRGMRGSPSAPESADVFHTRAWKSRTLQSQLAAWTELRHDMLLYSKQSYTPPVLCEFPDGYVDPYPECWERLARLAEHTAQVISTLPLTGTWWVELRNALEQPQSLPFALWNWSPVNGYSAMAQIEGGEDVFLLKMDAAASQDAMIAHFESFASRCRTLREIAETQAAGQPLTSDQQRFIGSTVEDMGELYVAGRTYSGWFPQLYYRNGLFVLEEDPSAFFKPVVVDVHTDGEDLHCGTGDPGAILYQGTGLTNLMYVAVRHPDGSACMYAGPVSSHYEFNDSLAGSRMTDEEWLTILENGEAPAAADWTSSFQVPRE